MKIRAFFFSLALLGGTLLAFGQAGQLDSTFGQQGAVYAVWPEHSEATAVLVQADGKVLVGGSVEKNIPGNPFNGLDMGLARYWPDGTVDSTFGQNGRVRTDLSYYESLDGLALRPDGRIIVAGHENFYSGENRLLACQYLPDGTLDPGFGDHGCRTLGLEVTYGHSFALQPDGKLLMAGYGFNSGQEWKQLVYRLDQWGNPDPTFGNNGMVSVHAVNYMQIHDMLVKPDGKIVLCGLSTEVVPSPSSDMAVLQFGPDGTLDTDFGGGSGFARFGESLLEEDASAVALAPDGVSVLFAGFREDANNNYQSILLKISATGLPDNSFGTSGWAWSDSTVLNRQSADVAYQPDGKILLVGTEPGIDSSWGFPNNVYKAFVARFLYDGMPDSTFGEQGKSSFYSNSQGNYWNALTLDAHHRGLFVAGTDGDSFGAGGQMVVAKYKLDLSLGNETLGNHPPKIFLQTSPNPAASTTTLRYFLSGPSEVEIELFDRVGNALVRLAKGLRPEGEQAETLLFPQNLPGGDYVISLKTRFGKAAAAVIFLNR